jgi:hypothetical protein
MAFSKRPAAFGFPHGDRHAPFRRRQRRIVLSEKPVRPDSSKWEGELLLDLVGHLQDGYFQTLMPLVKSTLYRDTTGRPTFKFEIRGDLQKQSLYPEKLFSRWMKSISSGLGAKIKSEFKAVTDE